MLELGGGKKKIWEHDEDYAVIERSKSLRLDLACGNAKAEGFVGVDISENTQADIVLDLEEFKWPWPDDSVYEIRCSHFVEHVKELGLFMDNCYRILQPGGILHIFAPYWSHVRAWQDFTHVRAISEITFQYFSIPIIKRAGLGHYPIKCDFDIAQTRFIFESEWADRAEDAKEWARKHYLNVVMDIEVILRAVKPMRNA